MSPSPGKPRLCPKPSQVIKILGDIGGPWLSSSRILSGEQVAPGHDGGLPSLAAISEEEGKGMSWEDLVSGELTKSRRLVATSLELFCPSADFYKYSFLNACGREDRTGVSAWGMWPGCQHAFAVVTQQIFIDCHVPGYSTEQHSNSPCPHGACRLGQKREYKWTYWQAMTNYYHC